MYIRIKKIKGREYAYNVRNVWTNKGPRQKTIGYLGKLIRVGKLVKANDQKKQDFATYLADKKININDLSYEPLINELARFELINCGFQRENSILRKDYFVVDLANKKVLSRKKNAVIALNDGFLCETTLNALLDFVPKGEYDEEIGLELAKLLVSTGLDVQKEFFVVLYEKLMQK
ncbi:MAG TPA: hypothetical protein VI894_02250 [Candidatus Nanoarchaeia archaeon]|nr:hypothetical protein [Candidatus Nanoarchaeia archaeon]